MRLHLHAGDGSNTTSRSVTILARDAHAVIAGDAGRDAAAELIRRIDGLQADWATVPSAPIHLWLSNLRRKVEMA